MPDPIPISCHWCHEAIEAQTVVVTETERASTAVNDWILCSWACAHELVTRMLRSGRGQP